MIVLTRNFYLSTNKKETRISLERNYEPRTYYEIFVSLNCYAIYSMVIFAFFSHSFHDFIYRKLLNQSVDVKHKEEIELEFISVYLQTSVSFELFF